MRYILLFIISILCFDSSYVFARDPFEDFSSGMSTEIIQLHYANASNIAKLLVKNPNLCGGHESIQADEHTNQLWMNVSRSHFSQIKQLLMHLDQPDLQIMIKARIVIVDDESLHNLGLMFGTQSTLSDGSYALDMGQAQIAEGTLDIPIAKLADGGFLDLQLSALQSQGHAKIMAAPELAVSNRQTASIQSGEEIPYQEKTGEGNTSVAFKKAVLRLKVTPTVLPNQKILLRLAVNQDAVSTLTVNGVPAIRTQSLNTEVLLKDNSTVVLGGIYEQNDSEVQQKAPIPFLSWLFRRHGESHTRKQLLIFVTPHQILR